MAGIPDKTIIFRKCDLWWPLLTSIFTWAKKWPKWLRTGSLRAVDRRIARPSSFPSFRVRGGHFAPPPPTMAKVAKTATRSRVNVSVKDIIRSCKMRHNREPKGENVHYRDAMSLLGYFSVSAMLFYPNLIEFQLTSNWTAFSRALQCFELKPWSGTEPRWCRFLTFNSDKGQGVAPGNSSKARFPSPQDMIGQANKG